MCGKINDRKRDEDAQSDRGTSAQTLALSARRHLDMRVLGEQHHKSLEEESESALSAGPWKLRNQMHAVFATPNPRYSNSQRS
jgi:hypothetical protein